MEVELREAVRVAVDQTLEFMEAIREQYIRPLGELGTPRQITGKPVSEWTPEQHQKLQAIFHTDRCPATGLCDYCRTVGEQAIKEMKEAEAGEADGNGN